MVTDDIGEIITEGFGGEIVRDSSSQEQQSSIVDLSGKTENENKAEQPPKPVPTKSEPAVEKKESSLNTESAQEQEQPKTEETVRTEPETKAEPESSEEPEKSYTDEDFVEVLNEEFGTKYKTLEDFDEALENKGENFESK